VVSRSRTLAIFPTSIVRPSIVCHVIHNAPHWQITRQKKTFNQASRQRIMPKDHDGKQIESSA
jgi:hypothetical protein